MLSAAIAAHLARGWALSAACARSLAFVHDALARGTAHPLALADIEAATVELGHLEELSLG
jgi:hydroxymethylpyrimidine/phosphomethylpyrimidine kinase